MDEAAAVRAYLPRTVLGAAAGRADVPDAHPGRSRARAVTGSLLFADVSGFVRLSERLARQGRAGAEEVVGAISTVFGPLIDVLRGAGGDVVKFSGDALLVLFEDDGHLLRAARAAVGMRQALRGVGAIRTSRGSVRLTMSQGLHTGRFLLVHAGTGGYRDLVLVGPDTTATFALEADADPGQVLLSEAAAVALAPVAGTVVRPRADGRPVLLRAAPTSSVEVADVVAARDEVLQRYVPQALRGRLADVVAESEHRTVAVAFVPFTGCDELLARYGPDEVTRRLDRLVDETTVVAARHHVTLVCVDVGADGGKLMLASGAPDGNEQDAESLLRCCLELVAADPGLGLRAGLNRGSAYAGLVGSPARFTWSTMGDSVNVAARLAADAPAASVVATRDLLDHVPGRFAVTDLPPYRLKGKQHPVRAAVVEEVLAEPVVAGPTSPVAPFVGRGDEQAAIEAAGVAALAGQGCVVEVVGEPGVGKTRLLARLRDAQVTGPAAVLWLHCERHERSQPYSGTRRLLRALLGIAPGAEPERAGRQLLAWLTGRAPHLLPVSPLLAAATGASVASTPQVESLAEEFRVARLHDAVEALLDVASPGPTVVVVDEVGRLDEASRGALGSVLRSVRRRPWLVVTARRPGEEGLVADPVSGRQLTLRPLASDEAALLVRAAAASPLPRADVDRLVERARGNPLFLLELVRASGEDDVLPDSVEAILAGRIDRLRPAGRRLLRYAAVLGERVDPGLLTRVLAGAAPGTSVHQAWASSTDHGAWAELRGLLVPEPTGGWRFEHQLLRRVAYDSLPFTRRRELHARTAAALEQTGSADLAVLALHHSAAGDRDRCWRYAVAAAQQARDRYAPGQAADLFALAVQSGAGVDEVDGGELAAVAERLGDCAEVAGRYRQALSAYTLARRRAPLVDLPRLLGRTGRLHERMGRYPAALGWFTKGLRAAATLEESLGRGLRVQMLVGRAGVRYRQGRYEDAVGECRTAVALADPVQDRADLAHAWFLLDAALTDLGRPDEAAVWRERALPVFEDLGDLVRQADVLNNLGIDAYYEGRLDDALAYYVRSRRARAAAGDVVGRATADNNIAEVLSDQGRLAEAEDAFVEASATWTRAGFPVGVALATSNLGRLRTRQGRPEEAMPLLRRAVAGFEDLHAVALAVEAEARVAEALLAAGRATEALALSEDLLGRRAEVPGVAQVSEVLVAVRDGARRVGGSR